jgi:hypothetical protein
MYLRRCVLFAFLLFAAACLAAPRAHAQTRIGEAVLIKNEVLNAATTGQINVGDGVLRDETVQTGAESAARLVMADSTNLSLGANASLKLDRSVFNDEHSYRDIAIRLTTGAFRFVTGHSEKTAYKITTPLATIGVRRTILDIRSQRGSSTVVLQEGAASVCPIRRLHRHTAATITRHRQALHHRRVHHHRPAPRLHQHQPTAAAATPSTASRTSASTR